MENQIERLERKLVEQSEKLSIMNNCIVEYQAIQSGLLERFEKRDQVLFGIDGRSGIVRDVNDIQTGAKWAKLFFTSGALSGIGSLLTLIWMKLTGGGK